MRHLLIALALAGCAVQPSAESSQAVGIPVQWPFFSTLAAGNNNDYWDPIGNCSTSAAMCGFVGNAGGSVLTGLSAATTGCNSMFRLYNAGTVPITLRHNSSSSIAVNRIFLTTGHDETWRPGRTIVLSLPCDYTMFTGGTYLPYHWIEVGTSSPAIDSAFVSTPTRVFGTAFQPSATSMTEVHYSVQIDSTISISGGSSGRVEFLSDSSNPPTTIREQIPGGLTGTVVVGLTVSAPSGGVISYTVPAGDFALLRTVNVVGTPTYTITKQLEETF